MLKETKPVWTLGRKIAGNALPLLFAFPLFIYGVIGYPTTGMTGSTLAAFALFPVVGWLATNLFGPCGSWGLKDKLGKKLHHERPFDKTEKYLVGFARPSYRGLLDPHEDIGFLLIHPDRLEFFGDRIRVELDRKDVKTVGFRPNPHTWLFLGRWVSIEGETQGKPVRLLIEPRERATLIGNMKLGSKVHAQVRQWINHPASRAVAESLSASQ